MRPSASAAEAHFWFTRNSFGFPMYNAKYDWGTIDNQKFALKQLAEMKEGCEPHCFSTLGYNVAYCTMRPA